MSDKKIIVVDDDPDLLQTLTEALGGTYEVAAASDWRGLLRLLSHEAPPDAILLDVLLPGFNGIELLATLKCRPAERQIPVILMTAMGNEARGQAMEYGAADYVTKPLSMVQLFSAIERAITAPSTRTPVHMPGSM